MIEFKGVVLVDLNVTEKLVDRFLLEVKLEIVEKFRDVLVKFGEG